MEKFFENWVKIDKTMFLNDDPNFGGIIDQNLVSGKWFCVFQADIKLDDWFDSREAAMRSFYAIIQEVNK